MSSEETSASEKSEATTVKTTPITMRDCRARADALMRLMYLVLIVATGFALFYSWSTILAKGHRAMHDLVIEQLRQGTQTSGTILMKHYEHVTTMTRTIANMRPFFNCTQENMKWLVRFINNFQELTQLKVSSYHVGEIGQQSCHFVYDDAFQTYEFYYTLIENGEWKNYKYPADVVLDPFNPQDTRRTLTHTMTQEQMDAMHAGMGVENTSEVMWTYEFPFEPNLADRPVFTCYTRGLSGDFDDYDGWVALSVPTGQYDYLLNSVPVAMKGKIMLMNDQDGVVYESSIGSTSPTYVPGVGYRYPTLEDLDFEFWPIAVRELANGTENDAASFTINESVYITLFYDSTLGFKHHRIWALMQEDTLNDEPNYYVSRNMVFEVIALFLMVLFVLFVLQLNRSCTRRKMDKRIRAISYTVGSEVAQFGPLGEAIWRVRRHQLAKPEQNRLSKVLDHAILSVSHPRVRRLNKDGDEALMRHRDCGFCKHMLTDRTPPSAKKVDSPYKTWQALTLDYVNLDEVSLQTFDYDKCVMNPSRFVAKLFTAIIKEHELFFSQFDPDAMIRFALDFSSEYCTDPVETAIELFAMHQLVARKFVSWIPDKLYLLAIYFAVLVRHAAGNRLVILSEELEKAQEVLTDPRNQHDIKCELVFLYLHGYIQDVSTESADPVVQQFCTVVKDLLGVADFGRHFEALCQFRIAAEAADFSCSDSEEDCMVFMKALFAFVCFAPYWTIDQDHFGIVVETFSCQVFTPEEWQNADFVVKYHHQMITHVVNVWVMVFSNFVDCEDIKQALATSAGFLEQVRESPTNTALRSIVDSETHEDSPIVSGIKLDDD